MDAGVSRLLTVIKAVIRRTPGPNVVRNGRHPVCHDLGSRRAPG